MIFIKKKKYIILISLMLLVLIIKIAFPSNIITYDSKGTNEVNQQIIKAPSEFKDSILNKDGENFNLKVINLSIYSLILIVLSIVEGVFTIFFLCRRLLFAGNKKIYNITTIYFNVGKYKDMIISSII